MSECSRCGSPLKNGLCTDVACPFNDHEQSCPVGWTGHPEHKGEDCCTCNKNGLYLCVTKIKWDEGEGLPEMVIIPNPYTDATDEEIEEKIADFLSDQFSFCHDGFEWFSLKQAPYMVPVGEF